MNAMCVTVDGAAVASFWSGSRVSSSKVGEIPLIIDGDVALLHGRDNEQRSDRAVAE
jgi:hypothetical protein